MAGPEFDRQWKQLVVDDVAGELDEADRQLLRSDDSLGLWRTALVGYQRWLEVQRKEHRTQPDGDPRSFQNNARLLRAVQARFIELRGLEKAANRRKQKALQDQARQRRIDKERHRHDKAALRQQLRSSPQGQRLHNNIHQRALRLNRWAARLVEEMQLDEQDPSWSRWLDDHAELAEM